MIRSAIEARLNYSDLLVSLVHLYDLYEKAGFSAQARYGMFRKAVIEDKRLFNLLLIKVSHTLNDLKCSIVEFVKNSETFQLLGELPKGNHKSMSFVHTKNN